MTTVHILSTLYPCVILYNYIRCSSMLEPLLTLLSKKIEVEEELLDWLALHWFFLLPLCRLC